MAGPERDPNNSNLVRQVLVAWVVAVWAVAIGAFLLIFHELDPEDPMTPRWHRPPIVGAEDWDHEHSVRHDRSLPQSGSSIDPETLPADR